MTTDTMNIRIDRVQNSRINTLDQHNIPFGKIFSDHMFIADYDGENWTDMRIVPFEDMKIHPANSMMHYGQTIFEGLKAYKNEEGEVLIFRPEKNAARLVTSAERMCMAPVPEELFMEALHKLIDLDREWVPSVQGTSLYIRPFVIAWDNFLGIRPSTTYRFMIITCPVGKYYSEPVKVKIETEFSRAAMGGTGSAKTGGNYAGSLYPAKKAQEQGFHQLVWTDSVEHKYIEESGTMNVMFMINDTLITSPTSSTILHGITRDSILQIAKKWNVKVEERPVTVAEVVEAAKSGNLQEAFGAGTAATIAQIESIGHEGEIYTLKPVEEREFSNKVAKFLTDLKTGKEEDSFNWVYKL